MSKTTMTNVQAIELLKIVRAMIVDCNDVLSTATPFGQDLKSLRAWRGKLFLIEEVLEKRIEGIVSQVH